MNILVKLKVGLFKMSKQPLQAYIRDLNYNEGVDATADDDDDTELLSALNCMALFGPVPWPLKCKTQLWVFECY